MISEGQELELTIEKPAAGGRMIARHHGQIVFVRGAIPGERVRAWIDRVDRQLAHAVVRTVIEPSPDRREPAADPLCGGSLYGHIAYPRQLQIKQQVIQDAFARIGRLSLDAPVDVRPSPEHGYRMRARLHVRGARAGFYREGTHQLCDAASTGQLSAEAVESVALVAAAIDREMAGALASIEVSENMAGDQRALHFDLAPGARLERGHLERARPAGVTGISARGPSLALIEAGEPAVSDPLSSLAGSGVAGDLRRRAESFFQANRFLVADLVTAVLALVPLNGEVLDLYSGVGLFAVVLAAAGAERVTAVEGDRASGDDLARNAAPFRARLAVHQQPVEEYLRRRTGPAAATLIVDPPRTGLSKDAAAAIIAHGSPRVVYVSCDPPTLARDARRLLDAGYALTSIRALDFFPNTPHLETVGVFER
ncbi:MAG TPA: TRAM domain-containing protein [Vicinamibacterales bacterium]|nr:TRAM domain-containing protein [Vicinamibacterales bacterium]